MKVHGGLQVDVRDDGCDSVFQDVGAILGGARSRILVWLCYGVSPI